MNLSRKSRTWKWTVGIVVLLIGIVANRYQAVTVYDRDQDIQYDDFAFAVTTVQEWASKAVQPPPHRQFYTVVVRVKNKARRVDFDFQPSVVSVQDSSGDEMTLRPDLAREAKAPNGGATERLTPGQTIQVPLIFEGLQEATNIRVRFRFGGALGLFLDTLLSGDRRVEPGLTQE